MSGATDIAPSGGETQGVEGRCHCGALRVTATSAPEDVTECGCSICRRYGALWAYYPRGRSTIEGPVRVYAWGPGNVLYQTCGVCACVVGWRSRSETFPYGALNARMLDGIDLAVIPRIVEADASV